MSVTPCKAPNQTFGKFISNALGDPYVDPGKYNLRRPNDFAVARSNSAVAHKVPFGPSGSNKTVRKSEFEYHPLGPAARPVPEKKRGFINKKTYDPFTN